MLKPFKNAEESLKQGLKLGIKSQHVKSLTKFERALAVFRQVKDRGKEALTLNCMG